ncbi:cupin domain-containing protein [Amycolatopsis aidingensis]|uniref:cupin domain-containing protein n=1 Tax=Amycolatopsis aidingensis TaxID=2842453 RepID=UPI001C0CA5CC|nr:cupin domain-containing protein [Amycolatopsis aidingensis]
MTDYDPFTSDVEPASGTHRVRRIVTGLGPDGASTVLLEDEGRWARTGHGTPTYVVTDLWRTYTTPADNSGPLRDPMDTDEKLSIAPTATGTVFRTLELPPDAQWRFDRDGNEIRPLAVHTTRSIDYAIVLSGEVWAVLDATEVRMQAGDVLVQRGTSHAWSNRSDEPCLMAFVLVGGNLPQEGSAV